MLAAVVADDPIAGVLLALVVILVVAKAGGELAVRLGQPAVLGELCAGMILGNLTLLGFHGLEFVEGDAAIQTLAHLGVILLLFEVGLIFANLGGTLVFHGQPLLSSSTFSSLVIVVMITTLITPPLLRVSLARARDAR